MKQAVGTSVQSLQRAFFLLEILSRTPSGLTLGELSLRTGLHKSTVHRLLGTLIALGYVRKRGVYMLTSRLFELGARVVECADVTETVKPLLRGLSVRIGETVNLVIRDGTESLCVYTSESPLNELRMVCRVGKRRPLYSTAAGKAILAPLPDEEIQELWESSEIVGYTPRTITRLEDFLKDLARTRARGYAVDDEENEAGVRCVAAGLTDRCGVTGASYSVSGPVSRMTPERIRFLGQELLELKEKMKSV